MMNEATEKALQSCLYGSVGTCNNWQLHAFHIGIAGSESGQRCLYSNAPLVTNEDEPLDDDLPDLESTMDLPCGCIAKTNELGHLKDCPCTGG